MGELTVQPQTSMGRSTDRPQHVEGDPGLEQYCVDATSVHMRRTTKKDPGLTPGPTDGDQDLSEDADDMPDTEPAHVLDSQHRSALFSATLTFLLRLFLTAISSGGQRWQCRQSSPRPQPA